MNEIDILHWTENQIKNGSIFEFDDDDTIIFIENTKNGFKDEVKGFSLREIFEKCYKSKPFKECEIGETFRYLGEDYVKISPVIGKRISDGLEWRKFD